jgi:hypothetical protein
VVSPDVGRDWYNRNPDTHQDQSGMHGMGANAYEERALLRARGSQLWGCRSARGLVPCHAVKGVS